MKKKFWAPVLFGIMLIGIGCGSANSVDVATNLKPNSEASGLKLGDTYKIDGLKNIVVGVGAKPFEYVSAGESITVVSLDDTSFKAVIVPDKGVMIKVDPTKPSVLSGGKEKLNSMWPIGAYVLVEYDRANN